MNPVMTEPLAYLYLRSGQPRKALEELEKVWPEAEKGQLLSRQIGVLTAKGLAYLRMGALEDALQAAAEIRELVGAGLAKKHIRYHHYLMGMIELERKDHARAISHLTQAVDSLYAPNEALPHIQAWFISGLAQAHYEAGNLDKSREQYEKIGRLNIARLDFGDLYARSLYMLGKIAGQQGDQARAADYFRKFLDLWKNADPGLPEAAEARKQL
jgi:tetratricopeptide (TPR) repeat protein